MPRNVDILILSAVNTCWATPITMPTLLALIRTGQPPGEWLGPVGQLFPTNAGVGDAISGSSDDAQPLSGRGAIPRFSLVHRQCVRRRRIPRYATA